MFIYCLESCAAYTHVNCFECFFFLSVFMFIRIHLKEYWTSYYICIIIIYIVFWLQNFFLKKKKKNIVMYKNSIKRISFLCCLSNIIVIEINFYYYTIRVYAIYWVNDPCPRAYIHLYILVLSIILITVSIRICFFL